jgi:hypothetical protein
VNYFFRKRPWYYSWYIDAVAWFFFWLTLRWETTWRTAGLSLLVVAMVSFSYAQGRWDQKDDLARSKISSETR